MRPRKAAKTAEEESAKKSQQEASKRLKDKTEWTRRQQLASAKNLASDLLHLMLSISRSRYQNSNQFRVFVKTTWSCWVALCLHHK